MSNAIDRQPTSVMALGVFAVVALRVLEACRTDYDDRVADRSSINIELLGFSACPNTPAMRENLRTALADDAAGLPRAFDDVDLESLPESDPRRGWPAPTILVDGADLFGMAPPSGPATGCRPYPIGVPDAQEIRRTLVQRACDQPSD